VSADGHRKEILVGGKKCADLWVAPDESVIAFITIDNRSEPPDDTDWDPSIQSSIYIARLSDGFKPLRVALQPIHFRGRRWTFVRDPSVSPDFKTVYFAIPYTMQEWRLVSSTLPNGSPTMIGDVNAYCVLWGGMHSGELLTQKRDYGPTGVAYNCYLRSKSGQRAMVAEDRECGAFDVFAVRWSAEHGGACRVTTSDLNRNRQRSTLQRPGTIPSR
jgi:hypothetical protein